MKTKKNNYTRTVLIITVGFAVIFFITDAKWSLLVAILVGFFGIVSERNCRIFDFFWRKLAEFMGFVIPNIILSLIFYLFVFPLSILSKIFGKNDNLNLKNKNNSLWNKYNKTIDTEYFEKTW